MRIPFTANHARVAANLLRNAAKFFRDVAGQNPQIREQMENNARTYDTVANLVETDPGGELPDVAADGGEGKAQGQGRAKAFLRLESKP